MGKVIYVDFRNKSKLIFEPSGHAVDLVEARNILGDDLYEKAFQIDIDHLRWCVYTTESVITGTTYAYEAILMERIKVA
jgi:hypothetical protein